MLGNQMRGKGFVSPLHKMCKVATALFEQTEL